MTDRPILFSGKPILFSGSMVRAIIEGRKTQTRRVLKLANRLPEYIGPRGCTDDPSCWGWSHDERGGYWLVARGEGDQGELDWSDWTGAYRVGDRLWVRETWTMVPYTAYLHSAGVQMTAHAGTHEAAIYRAGFDRSQGGIVWRSPIHMPRWASRLTLTVTDVRAQRLQDISEDDAVAEGCPCQTDEDLAGMEARGWFHVLWDSLNAKRGFGWDVNPWVAAISFTAHQRNIDQLEAA